MGGGLSLVGLVVELANGVLYLLVAPLNKALASSGVSRPQHRVLVARHVGTWIGRALRTDGYEYGTTGRASTPCLCLCVWPSASIVAYLLCTRGMAAGLEISRVPVITLHEAVVSALVGFVVLHELLGAGQLAGTAGVIGSIAVMNLHAPQG